MILDYKYIEQLLEGYFNGETTIEEEKILRAFFCQDELPEDLLQYRDIFVYQQNETKEDCLGADFDAKIMALIEEEKDSTDTAAMPFLKVVFKRTTKALHPFFQAAAIVAVVITIGNASQALFNNTREEQQGVAQMETTSGKNVADVQKGDSIIKDSLAIMND